MEIIKTILELIFSPLGILTILLSAGIILSFHKRLCRIGYRFLTGAGILFLVFLFSPLAQYLMLGLERQHPPLLQPPPSPQIDRIVVLAGYAEDTPGIPITSKVSVQTISSLSEGLRLYRLIPGAKLIASGGVVRKNEQSLAASMVDFLRQMGVPAEDLIAEGKSRNTYENLVEVKNIIGSRPFILAAQACDLPRAIAVAKKLQMQPVPAPASLWTLQHYPADWSLGGEAVYFFRSFACPSITNLSRLQWAFHEYAGLLWYRMTGRI
jgi:uncharacterized SAM-binding protein YcdF (DUF218 family)